MVPTLLLACTTCGGRAFTVRGQCEVCAPKAHENYRAAKAAVSEMLDRFERETGKSPLSVWREYEAFVERQPDAHAYAEVVARDSQPK